MATTEETLTWRGMDLRDRDGDKIGTIDEIYEDTDTGKPEWALVHTGLFGTKRTFVPLREASMQGDGVTVPYEKSHVKDAPGIDPDGALSREEEQALYQHYSLSYSTSRSDSGLPEGSSGTREFSDADTSRGSFGGAPPVGNDVSGPETDNAMTRSEEELDVGTTREARGSARLRKYVVTENVQTTVPVQREELRVEREPITDANAGQALDGPAISEEEHEVTLHEERPVVSKQAVPKERVRLDKETVTDEETVSEEVRKEQIEMEGDADRRL
jgi:uncharacterized protein (TIGR02271 family)